MVRNTSLANPFNVETSGLEQAIKGYESLISLIGGMEITTPDGDQLDNEVLPSLLSGYRVLKREQADREFRKLAKIVV